MLMSQTEWHRFRKWRIGFAIVLILMGSSGLVSLSRHHSAWGTWADMGFVVTGALLLVDRGRRLVFPAMLAANGASQYASALRAGQQPDLFTAKLLLVAAPLALLGTGLEWLVRSPEPGVADDEDPGSVSEG